MDSLRVLRKRSLHEYIEQATWTSEKSVLVNFTESLYYGTEFSEFCGCEQRDNARKSLKANKDTGEKDVPARDRRAIIQQVLYGLFVGLVWTICRSLLFGREKHP